MDALAAILASAGRERRRRARAWAASSPLADTAGRRGRGSSGPGTRPGPRRPIIDLPLPLDDETIERLAGPVRERLG